MSRCPWPLRRPGSIPLEVIRVAILSRVGAGGRERDRRRRSRNRLAGPLQGFVGPKAHDRIAERFAALPMIVTQRADHIATADIRNACRRRGVQLGTVDALLVRLCLRHDLVVLTTDGDFHRAARHQPLQVWRPSGP